MPESETTANGTPESQPDASKNGGPSQPATPAESDVYTEGRVDDGYNYYDDPYSYPGTCRRSRQRTGDHARAGPRTSQAGGASTNHVHQRQ